MRYKYTIDRDTRRLLISHVRKYNEYRNWLRNERERLIGSRIYQMDDMPHSGNKTSSVEIAIQSLEELDISYPAQVVHAIDQARNIIGNDMVSDEIRDNLKNAIWLSCINPREYNFELFAGTVGCEYRSFYYRKNEFLYWIKINLHL